MCEKYCRAGQATDDNMAHARCMAGCQILQKHTLRICDTCCFTLQQRLHEYASILRYKYVVGLFNL
jgi:hypothetical protein